MSISLIFILCALGGYLLGSIPFGLVLTRLCGLGDIRKIGSGNIGATNVLRTGRKDLALLTVILDASKAGIAAFLAEKTVSTQDIIIFGLFTQLNIVAALIAGSCGVLGHNFPVWLKFKGGKGVASTFGFLLATMPQIALLALFTWLIVAFISRYSSLSAITAAVLTPVYAFFLTEPIYCIFYTAIAVLVLYRHHANIARLLKGEESKISFKKK
ncbi:MAG: glycerol-3-phosphate 1-O-acyltransferase PlsY [Alphaproteobacteria bacterium]|nr:glycerol-3-phosphate 1-O-acyltransferase PlsY [Alphaproteobacteria bacterium]